MSNNLSETEKMYSMISSIGKSVVTQSITHPAHKHLLQLLKKPKNRKKLSVNSVGEMGNILDGAPMMIDNKRTNRRWFVRTGRLSKIRGKRVPKILMGVFC